MLPEMIRTLGFSRTAGGSIYNAYLLSYLAITPLTGFLTDRLGARRVITCCSLFLGLGALLMGTTDTLWTACLFYAIAGLGASGMWTPVVTVVQRWFAPERRGFALGIMSTGYGLGFATTGALFPWVVLHFDWRYAWYFLGAGALTMVVVNALLLRSSPESTGLTAWGGASRNTATDFSTKTSEKIIPLAQVFHSRVFWMVGFSYFAVAYSLYGITTFLVDYARSQMGLPIEKASLLATVHGFSQVVGVLTVLPLSDRLGRKKTLILSNTFITATLLGVAFFPDPTLLYGLVGVLGVFYGATFPMYGACSGDYFPRDVMGTVMGAWTPFYGAGAILCHWITGLVRDSTGVYDQAFIINAAMAATALALIFLVKRVPEKA